MSGRLLEYAEALRTGEGLRKARRLRAGLLASHPVTVTALEDVMPHSVDDQPRKGERRREARQDARPRKRQRRAGSNEPTSRQLDELRRLSTALGRQMPSPPTRQAASFEIDRLRQVLSNIARSK